MSDQTEFGSIFSGLKVVDTFHWHWDEPRKVFDYL
jgi:hypothetical protein